MQALCKVGMVGICPELVYVSNRGTTRTGRWGRGLMGPVIEPEAQQSFQGVKGSAFPQLPCARAMLPQLPQSRNPWAV